MPGGLDLPSLAPKRLIVLGSTGSIGTQTLEVVRALNAQGLPPPIEVRGLAARRSGELLAAQAAEFGAHRTVLTERDGDRAAVELVEGVTADLIVSAMVGAAGLAPTLRAIELGIPVAIANKETLVAAGSLMTVSGAVLLPIDSEHSAVWQCVGGRLPMVDPEFRVVLTASGGPFRTLTAAQAYDKPRGEALNHPRWNMGAKITIDSATMVNKAFEMIEARWLFGVTNDQIDVLIHPQSIVHSMVEHVDGSLIAQLGSPDMKGPIGYALLANRKGSGCWRREIGARRLSFREAMSLEFAPACEKRWEALALARWVIDESFKKTDSALGAVFNAANEVVVESFLAERLAFGRITGLCREVMQAMSSASASTLEGVLAVDAEARRLAAAIVTKECGR